MQPQRHKRDALLAAEPPPYPRSLWPAITRSLDARHHLLLVLDDDPTGTQTVHGLPVLTVWDQATLRDLFAEPINLAYILTNSRSLPPAQAHARTLEIVAAIGGAAAATSRSFGLISRSDSTLRGHYPLEIDALAEGLAALGHQVDGHLLVPFFGAGGRLTIDSIHYVAEGDDLVPAAATEYARDPSFGYRHSFLPDWVAEKSNGRWQPPQVARLTLHDLRVGGPARVLSVLRTLRHNQPCVVDAACDGDLEVLVSGILAAEAGGARLLARSAASFVRVRGGITERKLLTAAELVSSGSGPGLVVAGSYISKSSQQIAETLLLPGVAGVELPVDRVLAEGTAAVATPLAAEVDALLRSGRVPLLYSSRGLRTAATAEENLAIGHQVSAALVAVVQALAVRPAWLLAKGGITSSDVATAGLGMHRAEVLGQLLPGVPVWRAGPESRFPDLCYIVFPGNVGGPDAIATTVSQLMRVA